MICKNCNKKGKIGDIYCDDCGSKLEKETIHLSEKAIRNITIILITLLFLCTILKIITYMMSPSYIATKYFKAITENDTTKIYSYIEKNESDFVNEDILKEKMNLFENVDQYKIINTSENNNEAIVEFEYVIDNEVKTAYVKLNKTKNGIFDIWNVESGKIIENISIKVPKNSDITVDGKDIKKYLKTGTNEYYDYYEIPYMIAGKYTIKTTNNDITVEDEIELESNHTYTVGKIELNNELADNLEKQTVETLNYLYTNAIQNKNYDEIKENLNNKLENAYKSLRRTINQSNIKVNGMNIDDIQLDKATYDEEGNLEVTLVVDYMINYTYKVNGEEKTASNNATSKTTVTFVYQEGNYYLNDIVDYPSLKVRW